MEPTTVPAGEPGSGDPAELLCGALEGLARFVAGHDGDAARQAAVDLQTVVDVLVALLAQPDRLDVTDGHRSTAVALVAAYLDRSPGHGLLVEMLGDCDRNGRGDPAYRLALLAAMAQLAGDALATAVVGWTRDASDEDLTEETLVPACLTLLQRIALAGGYGAGPPSNH